MEIKASRTAHLAEAKEIILDSKSQGELGYEQAQALENLEKFSKNTPEDAKNKTAKIVKAQKIGEDLAVQIVDLAPNNPATLKAILAKDKVSLSDEEIGIVLKELA